MVCCGCCTFNETSAVWFVWLLRLQLVCCGCCTFNETSAAWFVVVTETSVWFVVVVVLSMRLLLYGLLWLL